MRRSRGVLYPQGSDAIRHILSYLDPDLHSYAIIPKWVSPFRHIDPQVIGLPSIKEFGNIGARAIRRPPKPQPMSANSTFFSLGIFG